MWTVLTLNHLLGPLPFLEVVAFLLPMMKQRIRGQNKTRKELNYIVKLRFTHYLMTKPLAFRTGHAVSTVIKDFLKSHLEISPFKGYLCTFPALANSVFLPARFLLTCLLHFPHFSKEHL